MGSFRSVARKIKDFTKSALYPWLPKRWLIRWTMHRLPKAVTLEVTTHCGLDCPLCPTHIHARSNRLMPPEQALKLIGDCEDRLRSVSFHMQGEPLMHKGLFDLVRACSERGIYTGFSSNGMLVDRYQDEILDSGLSFVSIAIDGCDAQDYEKYRVGGDFEKVTGSLRRLLSAREERGQELPVVQIQTIMFPYNEEREGEVVQFMQDFGADEIRLKRPSYCAEGDEVKAPPQALDFLQVAGEDRAERRYARKAPSAGKLFRERALCPQLERAGVLSDGRVVACCMDSTGQTAFGDLAQESFHEIWRGPRHRERIQQFLDGDLSLCRHCDLS